jgi:hypothetical protein
MRMSHIYQPLMLLELLGRHSPAPAQDVARRILGEDVTQIDYYTERVKRMVGKVLTGNGITAYANGAYSLIGADELSEEERDELQQLCRQRLDIFRAQRGEEVFAHRSRNRTAISGSIKYQVLSRARGRCECCGAHEHQRALEVDHIVPKNHGGSDDISNLQALCFRCNAGKRDTDTTDFRGVQASYRYRQEGCVFCELEVTQTNQNPLQLLADSTGERGASCIQSCHFFNLVGKPKRSSRLLHEPELMVCEVLRIQMSGKKSRSSTSDSYRFTNASGSAANLQEFDDGIWKAEILRSNEQWSINDDKLVYTKTSKKKTTTTIYNDPDGDGIYTFFSTSSLKTTRKRKTSGRDSITGSHNNEQSDSSLHSRGEIHTQDGYRFSLSGGAVTNLQEYDDGRWKNEKIDGNETWSFDGTNLLQNEVKRFGIEVSTYSDADGDGIFTKVSEIFNPNM